MERKSCGADQNDTYFSIHISDIYEQIEIVQYIDTRSTSWIIQRDHAFFFWSVVCFVYCPFHFLVEVYFCFGRAIAIFLMYALYLFVCPLPLSCGSGAAALPSLIALRDTCFKCIKLTNIRVLAVCDVLLSWRFNTF